MYVQIYDIWFSRSDVTKRATIDKTHFENGTRTLILPIIFIALGNVPGSMLQEYSLLLVLYPAGARSRVCSVKRRLHFRALKLPNAIS